MLTPERQEGWARLFLETRSLLIHGLMAMTGDVDLAEEVADEALLIIRDYYDRYENPRAVLFMIARQELYRRSQRVPVQMVSLDEKMEDADQQSNRTTGSDLVDETDENVDVMNLLKELPTRQREAVALTVMCDLGAAEAAEILGISESSVNTHKQRGLAKLQELYIRRSLTSSQNGTQEPVTGGIA